MSKEELLKLEPETRIVYSYLTTDFKLKKRKGKVVEVYNGNYRVNVWFDGESTPRVVGYKQIQLDNIKSIT